MPLTNSKNMLGSQAAIDLGLNGLGDDLRAQVEAATLNAKKKRQGQAGSITAMAPTMLGLAGADYGGAS
jgi:hypothetical protein